MTSRRAARRRAVELLYAADVRGASASELVEELALEDPIDPYTRHLVEGVARRRAEIDDLLTRCSIGWRVDRMSAVDRNVLRVGVLELLEAEVPPAVALDEAVVTVKELSGERAGSFVNGVLAGVQRQLRSFGPGSSSGVPDDEPSPNGKTS